MNGQIGLIDASQLRGVPVRLSLYQIKDKRIAFEWHSVVEEQFTLQLCHSYQ